METVSFVDFQAALAFLKQIKAGTVSRAPNGDGFQWSSSDAHLDEDQLALLEVRGGDDKVWTDPDTGLTWILRTHGLPIGFAFNRDSYFAGHNDWRRPSVTELKTLRSTTKNEHGVFVKPAVPVPLSGAYTCSTAVRKGCTDDGMTWNFTTDRFGQVNHIEGKIQWNASGGYAGFDDDKISGEGRDIYVRGQRADALADWCESLVRWAEENDEHDFPVTTDTILGIEALRIRANKYPPHLSRLQSLRKLHFYRCSALPAELLELKNLEELKWYDERFPAGQSCTLPDEIGVLTTLTSLTLEHVKLAAIPRSIGNLKNLRKLHINGSAITALPETVGQLEKLDELVLAHNNLAAFPSTAVGLKNLTHLTLSDRNLKGLPDVFLGLAKLESLVLDYSPVGTLPEHMFDLAHLKSLSAEHCSLTAFPSRLVELKGLQSLRVSFNDFDALPADIGRMTGLETLWCAATLIAELPESLKNLNNLQNLNISATPLKTFPEWLGSMPNLTHILAAKMLHFKKVPQYEGKKVTTYLSTHA